MGNNISRRNFLKTAGTLALVGFGINCAHYPVGMISDIKEGNISNKDTNYLLKTLVVYGEPFYVWAKDVSQINENQLPIVYTPVKDTTRNLNLNKNKLEIIADKEYILSKVKAPEGWTVDEWADEIELNVKNCPQTGVRGIRAKITDYDQLKEKIKRKSKNNRYGYAIKSSNKDCKFYIETLSLGSFGEFFFPHVALSKINQEDKLNFYNIPTSESNLLIKESCGNITIRNPNEIYRPKLYVPSQNSRQTIITTTPGQELDVVHLAGDETWEYLRNNDNSWSTRKTGTTNWKSLRNNTEAKRILNQAFPNTTN